MAALELCSLLGKKSPKSGFKLGILNLDKNQMFCNYRLNEVEMLKKMCSPVNIPGFQTEVQDVI